MTYATKTRTNFNHNCSAVAVQLRTSGKLGRKPISTEKVYLIRVMRQDGLTLQVIAKYTNLSIKTVFKYSANISCARRWNKYTKISRRTGMAVR
jgi:DNA-binding NarL/FixJ family response regulator